VNARMVCFKREFNLSCDHGEAKESQKQNAEKLRDGHCTTQKGSKSSLWRKREKRKDTVKECGEGV